MPYIVTTSEPFDAAVHVHRPAFSRVAVATLDEAQTHIELLGATRMADVVSSDGGTIGPLSDGTVIEVRPVLHAELARDAGLSRRDTPLMSDDAIVAAYNAQL